MTAWTVSTKHQLLVFEGQTCFIDIQYSLSGSGQKVVHSRSLLVQNTHDTIEDEIKVLRTVLEWKHEKLIPG